MGKMWTPENPDAEYTIASRNQNFNKWNYNEKDVQVQNNRYIRLKSLVIGYTIPKNGQLKLELVTSVSIFQEMIYGSGQK